MFIQTKCLFASVRQINYFFWAHTWDYICIFFHSMFVRAAILLTDYSVNLFWRYIFAYRREPMPKLRYRCELKNQRFVSHKRTVNCQMELITILGRALRYEMGGANGTLRGKRTRVCCI